MIWDAITLIMTSLQWMAHIAMDSCKIQLNIETDIHILVPIHTHIYAVLFPIKSGPSHISLKYCTDHWSTFILVMAWLYQETGHYWTNMLKKIIWMVMVDSNIWWCLIYSFFFCAANSVSFDEATINPCAFSVQQTVFHLMKLLLTPVPFQCSKQCFIWWSYY